MDKAQLKMEFVKLRKKHRMSKWNDIFCGSILLAITSFLLTSDYVVTSENVASVGGVSAAIGAIGGGFLGKAYREWKGTEELELAKAAIDKISE